MNNTKRSLLIATAVAMFAAVCPAGPAPEAEQKPGDIQLVLDLSGGSRLVGKPETAVMEVVASYGPQGTLTIPWASVERMTANDDKETFSLSLRDGQQLKAILKAKEISVTTSQGKLSVPAQNILAISVRGAGLPASLKEGLILHYTFDKDVGGKVIDESGTGNSGTVRGANRTLNGKEGSHSFDGKSDYIELLHSAAMNFAKDRHYTLSAWIYPASVAGMRVVLAKQNGNPQGDQYPPVFVFRLNDGHLALHISDPGFWETIQSTSALSPNRWYHVVAKQDGTSAVLYINGVQDISAVFSRVPGDRSDVHVNIGVGNAADASDWFSGSMDDVMVFNRALSGEEVAALYREQAPADLTVVVGAFADLPKGPADKDDLRLVLALAGGSRLIGTPSAPSADVVTSFGALTIPWRDVARMTANDDKETVAIRLRDGQQFKAVLKAKETALTTSLGKLSVPVQSLLCIEVIGSGMPASLKDGLILWNKMGSDEEVRNSTVGPKGNIQGTIHEYAPGVSGNAAHLRGSAGEVYFDIPYLENKHLGTDPFTISFWAKSSNISQPEGFVMDSLSKGTMMIRFTQHNSSTMQAAIPTSCPGMYHQWDTKYHHYAIVFYPNGRSTFYIDSVVKAGSDNIPSIGQVFSPRIVLSGAWDLTGGYDWNGCVDEVMSFSRALSAEEVRELFALHGGEEERGPVAGSSARPQRDPILFYSFDEDEGGKVTDRSGNGNYGTVNGPTWTSEGKVGGAYRFSGGKDHILVGCQELRKSSADSFSLAVWFYAEEFNMDDENTVFGISVQRGVNDGAFSYRIGIGRPNGQGDKLALGFTAGTWCRDNSVSPYMLGLQKKRWYHAVGVFDRGDMRIYVDGKEQSRTRYSLGSTPASSALLGCVGNSVGMLQSRGFNGIIDELMFYDCALTGDEVRNIYGLQVGGKRTDDGTPRMLVQLAKGSELVATVPDTAVIVATSLGKLDIPFSQVRMIDLQDGPAAARVTLVSGDIFRGAMAGKSMKFKTLLGELKIDVEQIREIDVVSGRRVTPREVQKGYTLILWNEHNSYANNSGTKKCNVELCDGTKTVWKKLGVELAWEPGKDCDTLLDLPTVRFDRVHIEVTEWVGVGGGLAEIQIIRAKDKKNIAANAKVTASGYHSPPFAPQNAIDGSTDSELSEGRGYWLLPDGQRGWIELSLPGNETVDR